MNYRKFWIGIVSLLGSVCFMSSEAKDKVSDDGLTVSHDASHDPAFEWTLERMLLAVPMPMTEEGRKFLSTHPSLDDIRSWTEAQFDTYLDSEYGRQHVAEEAWRWRDLSQMLKMQVTRGSAVLGKPAPKFSAVSNPWSKLSLIELRAMVDAKDHKVIFEQMKIWRQDIADLAKKVESIRKDAEAKGLSEKLEQALTPDSN